LGGIFILFFMAYLYMDRKQKLANNRLFLKVAVWSIPLPIIANELGWIAAEVGRQPWAVYGLLKTRDAVSITVPAGQILFSIIMFSLVYALLFFAWFYLLRRELAEGPEEAGQARKAEVKA
ncbi:MAG: cytochrome ubiquinol oxidase subunit I, partial [Planctomycetota bacterium]